MKSLIIFLIIFFISFQTSANAQIDGCSKDYSALVLEENSGNILFETRSDKTSYPASLVKLMTLYLTFEAIEKHHLTLETPLTISERGEEISKVNKVGSLHVKQGDTMTVAEAIHFVIVKSFNEAAVTLAEAVSGSEWEFVRKMNKKAEELGMINTSFRNASGLHEEGQYTTSYDLARLAIALKKDFPSYYHLFSMKEFRYRGTEYETHNHVLVDYKGAEGMKTGFTNASGFNLIAAAKKKDVRIFSILLGCESFKKRDHLTKQMLDQVFKQLENPHKSGVEIRLQKNFSYYVADQEEANETGEHAGMARGDE